MLCKKCKKEMNWCIDGCIQGWKCPSCGWDIVTTYIDEMYTDETEYSLPYMYRRKLQRKIGERA